MQGRKISKGTRLNRIIAVELLCLIILIGVYAGIKITRKGSEEAGATPNGGSVVTITPEATPNEGNEGTITPEVTPELTITPGAEEEDNSPEKDSTSSNNGEDQPNSNMDDTVDNAGSPNQNNGDTSDATDTNNSDSDVAGGNTGISEGTGAGNSSDSDSESENGDTTSDLSQETFLVNLSEAQSGELLKSDGAVELIYYMQTDSRWGQKIYGGTDTIEKYGCGPTSLAMVISTFTNVKVDPVQMCKWAYDRGYWFSESGSIHGLIPDAAKAFGLKVEGIENTPEAVNKIKDALSAGKLVITLMGKGTFTNSGHFIVLRGITEDGKILVADPNSNELTKGSYDPSLIVNEAKSWAAANGPFWVISK